MCRFCLAQKGVIMTGTTSTSAARARKAGTAGILGVVLAIAVFFGLAAAPQTALATDLEAGASQLTTQAVGVSATNITVGTPQDVIANEDNNFAQWFKFTAPNDGTFVFTSSVRAATSDDDDPYDDHGDPLAELYVESGNGDGNGLEQIDSDDDSAGNSDFRIAANGCKAGDVYYLKCKTYSDEAAHYAVTAQELDPYDISNLSYVIEDDNLVDGTEVSFETLGLYLKTFEKNENGDTIYIEAKKVATVKEGSWQKYDAEYDSVPCEENPSAAGTYYLSLVGKKPYKGELDVQFRILDSKNLDNYYTSGIDTVWSDGAPVELKDIGLAVYRDFGSGDCILKEGTDYELDYWTDEYDGDKLAQAPSEPGYYYAYVKGKGFYRGGTYWEFRIRDAKSLENYHASVNNDFWADGSAVTPEKLGITELYASYDNNAKTLQMGQDYKIDSWWDSNSGEKLPSAPSAAGDYYAKLAPLGKYTGGTNCYFQIRDPQSLSQYNVDTKYSLWADGTAASLEKLNLSVYRTINGVQRVLELGKDYTADKWYLDTDDELRPLTSAPKDPGAYCLELTGNGSYSGTKRVFFSICNPASLVDIRRNYNDSVLADGTPVTLERLNLRFWPRVGDTSKALVEDADYEVANWREEGSDTPISAPSKPGNYYVTVKGKGTYTGTRTMWFTILDSYSVKSGCYTYIDDVWADGSAVTPQNLGLELYTYASGSREALQENKDYKIDSWWTADYPRKLDGAPSAAGDYKVCIEGIGEYHDVVYLDFQIKDPQSLAEQVYEVVGTIWANGQKITSDRINVIFKRDYDTPDSQALKPDADYALNSWRDDDSERLLSEAPSGPGNYRVKYVGKGNYKDTRSIWITVKDPYNLGDYDTTAKRYIAYDGQGITFDKLGIEVSAIGEAGKKMVLQEGRDFRVAGWERWEGDYDEDEDWSDSGWMEGQNLSDIKEIGAYSVNLEGIDPYSGTVSVSFRIVDPKDLAYASVSGVGGPYYLEAVPAFAPVVKSITGDELKEGADYTWVLQAYNASTYRYENIDAITKAGEYRMYIEGRGSYKGAWTWEFGVSAHKGYSYDIADATVTVANKAYTGAAQKPAPTVKLNDMTLRAGIDYTVAYKNNTKAGTATATVTGKGVYSGSQSKTFKISAASIAKATFGKVKARAYTGKAQKPALTIKYVGKVLKAGTDYTVKYTKNVNAGTATATVTGKGNFNGTKKITFKINKAKISKAGFSKVKAQKLKKKGQAVKPKVTVKFNKKTLNVKKDYTITYKNNKKKGTASIIIKGKGNFTGFKTIKFKIK